MPGGMLLIRHRSFASSQPDLPLSQVFAQRLRRDDAAVHHWGSRAPQRHRPRSGKGFSKTLIIAGFGCVHLADRGATY